MAKKLTLVLMNLDTFGGTWRDRLAIKEHADLVIEDLETEMPMLSKSRTGVHGRIYLDEALAAIRATRHHYQMETELEPVATVAPVATNRYRKKPVEITAITFDELVQHGLAYNGASIVNGVPWSFNYQGVPISHENDDCYLIPTLEGIMRFNRGDMLITGIKGEIYPCKKEIFDATYDRVEGP